MPTQTLPASVASVPHAPAVPKRPCRRSGRWVAGGAALGLVVALGLGLGAWHTMRQGTTAVPAMGQQDAAAGGQTAGGASPARRDQPLSGDTMTYTVYVTDPGAVADFLQQQLAEVNRERTRVGAQPLQGEVRLVRSADEDALLQQQLADAQAASRYAEAPTLTVADLRTP